MFVRTRLATEGGVKVSAMQYQREAHRGAGSQALVADAGRAQVVQTPRRQLPARPPDNRSDKGPDASPSIGDTLVTGLDSATTSLCMPIRWPAQSRPCKPLKPCTKKYKV